MSMNNVLTANLTNEAFIRKDLNFRLRLDIAGADLRIEDKIIESNGQWYVDAESGLDIDFDIVKSARTSEVNESIITIYNLNSATYNKIREEATAFELYGACSNDEFALMSRGYPDIQIKRAKKTLITSNEGFMKQDYKASFRGQSDLPTVIRLLDGKINYQDATINKPYYGEVSSELIFNDVIESLGVIRGNVAEDITFKTLKNYSARGKSTTIMNYLANLNNFQWKIMNGVFEAYTGNKPPQPYGIILDGYNSSTPERQDDKFKTKSTLKGKNKKNAPLKVEKIDNGYMVETELLPFLNAGIFALCDFDILKGTCYIYKVRHIGNNYGVNCSTKLYMTRVD